MIITYHKIKKEDIHSVEELEKYIIKNNLHKYFKSFDVTKYNEINEKVKSTVSITSSNLLKFIQNWLKCETFLRKEFWIERGWTDLSEIDKKIKEIQSGFSKRVDRKNNPQMFNTKIEYYISRGYSVEDAELKLKERQSVFSREKMIKKYGYDRGNEIVEERNKKWFESLKKNNVWEDLSYKKGNNGLNQYKTLEELVSYYGELEGKKKFAKRYWNKTISTLLEFNEYETFLHRERTRKFYDKNYRYDILQNQNFKCGKCLISNKDARLCLHHIDFDKKNDRRKNLIFLCNTCHSYTTNVKKRDPYIKEYTELNRKFTQQ